ncbi:hypothetical protein FRB95_007679 [Tulasnella sp. JGI-2019a]|nr:hypothetical protein FRB95_007679 [Tulasnella sp. JGI-2019a]
MRIPGTTVKSTAPSKAVNTTTTCKPGPPNPRPPPPAPTTPHPLLPSPQTVSSPQNATPSGRWECLYVYAFLIKFLPPMVDDMYDAIDFENALVAVGFNQIVFDILERFIEQLLPQLEEPLTPENLTPTLKTLCDLHCKGKIRSIYWNEILQANQNPFTDDDTDFFAFTWERKLELLRQLVDWQLNNSSIKDTIDLSWEVKYERKKKKTNKAEAAVFAPPDEEDPMNIKNLRMVPLGQDTYRYRYWSVDKSPRVWVSTNPWKANCPVTAVSNTPEELKEALEKLYDIHGPIFGNRRTRFQIMHGALLNELEAKYTESRSHPEHVKQAKEERERQRQEEEEARLITLEEEQQRKNEISYRTRSRMRVEPVENGGVDEADATAAIQPPINGTASNDSLLHHHAATTSSKSTTTTTAKGKGGAANSKKRKREPSPAPSDPQGDPYMANGGGKTKGAKARASTTTVATTPSVAVASSKSHKKKVKAAVVPQDDSGEGSSHVDGENAPTAASSQTEILATETMPPPLPLLDTMELANGRRRSGRASTASITRKLDAAQIVDRTSSSSRLSIAGPSRRSSRLAATSSIATLDTDEHPMGDAIDVEHEDDADVEMEETATATTNGTTTATVNVAAEPSDLVTPLSRSSLEDDGQGSIAPERRSSKRQKTMNGHGGAMNGRSGAANSPSATSASVRMSMERWESSSTNPNNGAHGPESEADNDTETTLRDGGSGETMTKDKTAAFQLTVTPAESDTSTTA